MKTYFNKGSDEKYFFIVVIIPVPVLRSISGFIIFGKLTFAITLCSKLNTIFVVFLDHVAYCPVPRISIGQASVGQGY